MMMLSILAVCFSIPLFAQSLTAKEIIEKADDKMQGESNKSTMTMTIVRPGWERTITFKSWILGRDYALTLISSPPREKGQTFLKRHNDMWNWIPGISRMVKLPPSMMSQGWMDSDYTNDDLLKESSIVVDYEHEIVGEEDIDSYPCWKIKLVPKDEAAIVWGHVFKWISKEDFYQMKSEYYDEDGYLVRTEASSEIKLMDDRKIPTRFVIIPEEDPGNKTIVTINDISFDIGISESFFSQQNMKRVR
jgi:outer membrane lipoprotein-sorting protein